MSELTRYFKVLHSKHVRTYQIFQSIAQQLCQDLLDTSKYFIASISCLTRSFKVLHSKHVDANYSYFKSKCRKFSKLLHFYQICILTFFSVFFFTQVCSSSLVQSSFTSSTTTSITTATRCTISKRASARSEM